MKKVKDQNICVRIDRDEQQIQKCGERIQELNTSFSEMAQIFALAGNEVRLKTLFLLQEEKKLCVCDLSEILNMKIPAVSQHLRKLKDARLVYTEREGTVIFYHINPNLEANLNTILNLISEPVLTQL